MLELPTPAWCAAGERERAVTSLPVVINEFFQANSAHVTLARKRGAHVLENTMVLELVPIGKEGAKAITSKGSFTCKRVIMCAGPWTNQCLKHFGKATLLHPLFIM